MVDLRKECFAQGPEASVGAVKIDVANSGYERVDYLMSPETEKQANSH